MSPGIEHPWITCHNVGHMSQTGSHVSKWVTCLKVGHMSQSGSHVSKWVTCLIVGHMSQCGSHVSNWVTCHKIGHMSQDWSHVTHVVANRTKIQLCNPLHGPSFPVPSFRTDILCLAQQSNITPKPLLCVGMKAFFCFDSLTFVCLPSLCSKPPPRGVAIPPRGRKRTLAPGCHRCAHGIGPTSFHRSISLVLFLWSCSC